MNLKAVFFKHVYLVRCPFDRYEIYRVLPFGKVLLLEATEYIAAADFIGSMAASHGSIHVTWEE